MPKFVIHGFIVAACGLGIAILTGMGEALEHYTPTTIYGKILLEALGTTLTGAIAGAVHYLRVQDGEVKADNPQPPGASASQDVGDKSQPTGGAA